MIAWKAGIAMMDKPVQRQWHTVDIQSAAGGVNFNRVFG
jgi:hypothetical protein